MNYGKNGIKRMWQQGVFSNPTSYDELPQGMYSNMDVDSWGDLFQLELDRSWHLLLLQEWIFVSWKPAGLKKKQQNNMAKTGYYSMFIVSINIRITSCFMSLYLTFLFIALNCLHFWILHSGF